MLYYGRGTHFPCLCSLSEFLRDRLIHKNLQFPCKETLPKGIFSQQNDQNSKLYISGAKVSLLSTYHLASSCGQVGERTVC